MPAAKTKTSAPAIGLDIGHSAVKIADGDTTAIFPSAATPAVKLDTEEAGAAAKADTVTVDGTAYFVGETALIHTNGVLLDGLRDDWLTTAEHAALLASGWARALRSTGSDDLRLVLGLPSRLHDTQHDRLREIAALSLQIDKSRISVLPQPLAAFMAMVLDEDGAPSRDITAERWGIIDIGYYTADFGVVDGGVWSMAGAKSSNGASQMADALRGAINSTHGVNLTLRDADKALRTGSVRIYGKVIDLAGAVESAIDLYAKQIMEHAIAAFGQRLSTLDGILVAGGAANVVHARLRKEWPHAHAATNPRFAVAEGLRRYGLMKQL